MVLSEDEVSRHNTRSSCWVIIRGEAYDMTDFLDQHPAGPEIILKYAGKDATEEFEPVHRDGLLEETLSQDKQLGPVQMLREPANRLAVVQHQIEDKALEPKVPLQQCISLYDFEDICKKKLTQRAWTYFSSAADDSLSDELNQKVFRHVLFRPRVMRNVKDLDLSTTILGQHSSLPVFIAPAALAKLAHPDGECGLARGAGETGIIQIVSSSASMTPEAIASSRVTDTQCQFYQLYVVSERHKTEAILRRVKQAGYKGLVVTVDTAVLGKRELDERYKATLISETDEKPKPLGFTHGGWLTPTLCWDDLQWIRGIWDGPIAVKGIMTAEDALIAAQHGVQAIYLSNHGGRQLDTSPPSLMTLLEIRRYCPDIIEKVEIFLDGGFRRGNDVIKALALGARACGIGRPFMYALGAYGHEGVVRAVDVLRRELEIGMRLAGVTRIDELTPDHVNTKWLDMMVAEPAVFRLGQPKI